MTLVFDRPTAEPATHAFVIGVSDYAQARAGQDPMLRGIQDIPSADASAMRMADWLYEKRDALEAPLGSIELLLGGAAARPPNRQYAWQQLPVPAAVDQPTLANVNAAGGTWAQRLRQSPQSTAFFFICGHGAVRGGEPVVFLHDLNASPVLPWGAHINLARIAASFKQSEVKVAFFFADSCQEFLPRWELIEVGTGALFVPPFDPFRSGEEKVSLLSASSHGMLAYEGDWLDDPAVKMGRFTQTLLQAFRSSVRFKGERWIVYPNSIFEDIRLLHRIRGWRREPFAPSQLMIPNDNYPLLADPDSEVPIVTVTDPEAEMANCALRLFQGVDKSAAPLDSRAAGFREEWVRWLRASMDRHLMEATKGTDSYDAFFHPISPQDLRVRIS